MIIEYWFTCLPLTKTSNSDSSFWVKKSTRFFNFPRSKESFNITPIKWTFRFRNLLHDSRYNKLHNDHVDACKLIYLMTPIFDGFDCYSLLVVWCILLEFRWLLEAQKHLKYITSLDLEIETNYIIEINTSLFHLLAHKPLLRS